MHGVVTRRFERRLVGAGRAVGANLRPGALSALTDVPPARLADRRVPLAEVHAATCRTWPRWSRGAESQAAGDGRVGATGWPPAARTRRRGAELVDEAVDAGRPRTAS